MSLVLDTGTMKYRESPTDPWRPLVIKAGMNWESMADTYDPDNGTYEVGQYVLEEGMMYRCISEITTPEAWTPAHWTSVNVGDELSSFIIISDDQPTDETNKIWIAETTAPFGVQVPTMDDHNALGNTLTQLDTDVDAVEVSVNSIENGLAAVINGNTNTYNFSLTSGKYVYVKNNTLGVSEGLYTVKSGEVIAAGANVLPEKLDAASNALSNIIIRSETLYADGIGWCVPTLNSDETLIGIIGTAGTYGWMRYNNGIVTIQAVGFDAANNTFYAVKEQNVTYGLIILKK